MNNSHKFGLAALFVLAAFSIQACGSDSDPAPSDQGPIQSTGGKKSTGGGSGTGSKSGSGGSNLGGADPGTGGTGGSIITPPPERADCPEEADGKQPNSSGVKGTACWNLEDCNGVNDVQFQDQCNGTCFPFDNEARIANFNGTLPPL